MCIIVLGLTVVVLFLVNYLIIFYISYLSASAKGLVGCASLSVGDTLYTHNIINIFSLSMSISMSMSTSMSMSFTLYFQNSDVYVSWDPWVPHRSEYWEQQEPGMGLNL